MKKILLSLCIFAYCFTAFGVTIKMPSEDVLQQKFNALGLKHFVEKTSIIKELANEDKETLGIVMAFEFAIADYTDIMTNNPSDPDKADRLINLVIANKAGLCKALVNGNQEALNELKSIGIV